jgi:hypothetical protein
VEEDPTSTELENRAILDRVNAGMTHKLRVSSKRWEHFKKVATPIKAIGRMFEPFMPTRAYVPHLTSI